MALVAAVGVGTAGAQLPTPNEYNATPNCPVSSSSPVCGPWMPAGGADPSNPFSPTIYGGCQYWAIEKRPDFFNNDPNAYTDNWDADNFPYIAREEGLTVSSTPQVGDIMVYTAAQAGNSSGHVTYVEAVDPDGSIVVSEMNAGWSMQGNTRWVPNALWSSGGWQGLQFIPQGSGDNGSSSGGNGDSGGGSSFSRPLMRVTVSPIRHAGDHRRQIKFIARIIYGAGTMTAVAATPGHRVRLRVGEDRFGVFAVTGKLSTGRWTITVVFHASPGYASPPPRHLKVTVPNL